MTTKPYWIDHNTSADRYWKAIFGDEHPHNVIANFDLKPGDIRGFSEWLGEAESHERSEAYEDCVADLGDMIIIARELVAEDLQRAAQEVADEAAS